MMRPIPTRTFRSAPLWQVAIALSVVVLSTVGCGSPPARFRVNMPKFKKTVMANPESGTMSTENVQDLNSVLVAMFGTPDDPRMPFIEDPAQASVIDVNRLKVGSGPVGSDEQGNARGLYREHCVHCHGISGDGAGPTAAFLNPYPRDFRMGLFKFKSTGKGSKPTHDDLKKTLLQGIPGTAMPSFALLSEYEIESLTHYLKYLAVRGEVERQIIDYVGSELSNPEGESIDPKLSPAEKAEKEISFRLFPVETPENAGLRKKRLEEFTGYVKDTLDKWATSEAVPVPAETAGRDHAESIARGRALYYGAVANCFSCHGNTALGDGQKDFYDDWSQEWVEKTGTPQEIADATAQYVKYGALPPRRLIPRNLRANVYRGGRRPIDIYWRIINGIEGAQMPAAPMKAVDAGPEVKGLTPDDVWDIVHYVRDGLPYESISNPFTAESTNIKETN
jgi:mono/diheme cytochrome c family protein